MNSTLAIKEWLYVPMKMVVWILSMLEASVKRHTTRQTDQPALAPKSAGDLHRGHLASMTTKRMKKNISGNDHPVVTVAEVALKPLEHTKALVTTIVGRQGKMATADHPIMALLRRTMLDHHFGIDIRKAAVDITLARTNIFRALEPNLTN